MFKAEINDHLFIVRIEEENTSIDINNVGELKKLLKNGIEQGFKKIIVDFQKIDYIDSSGLGCLMDVMKDLKGKGGELGILSISSDVLEVFTATKIGQYFKFYKKV
ncbi:MAG: STAS domain-containing protein [Spirochaetes bacterium]|nr:STAS domain-containing protein [Spirochaetota bacterium]